MHYSGLLVLCRTESIYDCVRDLTGFRGFDVYASDPATGRIVVVLETHTLEEQEAGLRRAQSLPDVLTAELVYHYFGDEAMAEPPAPARSTP